MDNTFVFAMPGNPLSAYINTFALAIPTIRKISGARKYYYNFVYAKNLSPFKMNSKKDHTILGSLKYGKWQVYKDYKYGSSMISALSNSNSLVILNKGKEEVQKEELLKIIPFDIDFCEENLVFN